MLKHDILSNMKLSGSTATIIRSPTNITEYCDIDLFKDTYNSFRLGHNTVLTNPYNTQLVVGDFVILDGLTTNLVVFMEPTVVEQMIVSYNTVCYQTNASIDTYRLSKSGKSYNSSLSWTPQLSNKHAVIDNTSYNKDLKEDASPVQNIQQEIIYMYVPFSFGIMKKDRITVKDVSFGGASSGVLNYEVIYIDYFAYTGVSVLYIKEDNRP